MLAFIQSISSGNRAFCRVERPSGPLRVGAVGALFDPPASLDRVERTGRLASERLLDDHAFDPGKFGRGFVDRCLVAGDQRRPYAEAAGERRIERRLALLATADPQGVD